MDLEKHPATKIRFSKGKKYYYALRLVHWRLILLEKIVHFYSLIAQRVDEIVVDFH